MKDKWKKSGAKEIIKIDGRIANNAGTYIYGDKIIKVRHMYEDKSDYMRKYMADNKHIINKKRREKYKQRKAEGKCPKCGVNLPKNHKYILCGYCRKFSKNV